MASTPRPAPAVAVPDRPLGTRSVVRLGLLVLLAVALVGIAYAVARTTALFAVRTIEITGAPPPLERQLEAALSRFRGESLVGLDAGAVTRAARTIPAVRSASVDRAFPHTLEIAVQTEPPIAVARRGQGAWLVAASGKVLERIELGTRERLPRIWLPAGAEPLRPSEVLAADAGGAAAGALSLTPADFPARVLAARWTDAGLTLVLAGRTELRLGSAADVRAKLAAAAAVLRSLSPAERRALAYLDVSLPTRPVGADKSQVEA